MHTHTHTHTHYYQTRERETSLLKHMKAHSTVLIEFLLLWKMFLKKKSCLFCRAGEPKLSGCEFFPTHERIELNWEIVIPNFIGFVQSWPPITDTCHSPQFRKYFSCSLPNWSQKTIFERTKKSRHTNTRHAHCHTVKNKIEPTEKQNVFVKLLL